MVDKLVHGISGGIVFSKREVWPVVVVGDGEGCEACSDVKECCLTTIDVIERSQGDEIQDVIETASDKHIAVVGKQLHGGTRVMTVENIMVVHVSHNVGNPGERLLVEKDMTEASLAFDEDNLAQRNVAELWT